ncbi:MAG: FadR family transcriptional regulator [Desulfobacteraceae bacterium]|nr:FadR family transcriptional regulator [Desulfobacteraceae bacterium]
MLDSIEIKQSIKRTRVHEQVTRILLRRIIRGKLQVGQKLSTERAMALEFGVNRTTVREALRYLENLDLITIRQGDGAYVKNYLESGNIQIVKAILQVDNSMRFQVITAIMEIRRINSPEMAYSAALKRSQSHLQRLENTALNRWGVSVIERDKKIHHLIGLASGNILHVLMTNFYEEFYDFFGHLYFENEKNKKRSEKFHKDIFFAIKKQNAQEAKKIMREILLYSEKALFSKIKCGADA